MLQKRQQGFLIKFSWLPAVSAIKCMGCSQGDSQGNRIASHNGLFGRNITFAPFCLFSSHSPLSALPSPLSGTSKHFIFCCGRFCCKHERKLPVQKAKQSKERRRRRETTVLGQDSPSQIHHGGDRPKAVAATK